MEVEGICNKCCLRTDTKCDAGRVDTIQGMVITKCPDFTEGLKSIGIHEKGMREFLKEHFPKDNPTDLQISEFMDFLELDITDFIKENWNAFLGQMERD